MFEAWVIYCIVSLLCNIWVIWADVYPARPKHFTMWVKRDKIQWKELAKTLITFFVIRPTLLPLVLFVIAICLICLAAVEGCNEHESN